MNDRLKYGSVPLGVEAALPGLLPGRRPKYGYVSFRRTLIWLYAALKRWA